MSASSVGQFRFELQGFLNSSILGLSSNGGLIVPSPENDVFTEEFLNLEPGHTTYQYRVLRLSSSIVESNLNRDFVRVEIDVFRMLGGDFDERLYLNLGELYEQQRRLLETDSYRTLNRVVEVETEPTIDDDGEVSRVGNLIRYSVSLQVFLNKTPA